MTRTSRASHLFGLWKIPPRRVVAWTSVAAAPLAIVVTVGTVMSFHYHELLKDSRDRVDHSYQVLDAIDRIFVPLEDAEASQLAWVITGDTTYLASFRQAIGRIGPQMQRLRQVVGPGQEQADIDRLDHAMADKVGELGKVIELRSRQGFDAAREELAAGPAKHQSDAVRAALADISRSERDALKAGHEDARRKERHTVEIGAAVALLSIVTRIGVAWLLSHLRRRGKLHLVSP